MALIGAVAMCVCVSRTCVSVLADVAKKCWQRTTTAIAMLVWRLNIGEKHTICGSYDKTWARTSYVCAPRKHNDVVLVV